MNNPERGEATADLENGLSEMRLEWVEPEVVSIELSTAELGGSI